jgi:hypothetical protein
MQGCRNTVVCGCRGLWRHANPYAVPVRSQLRTIVFSVVIVVIVLGVIIEPLGGTVETVGLAVVLVTMLLLILRERRKTR